MRSGKKSQEKLTKHYSNDEHAEHLGRLEQVVHLQHLLHYKRADADRAEPAAVE